MPLSPDELELIAAAREVEIETRSDHRSARTVIWVVAVDGTVFVRSVRGDAGRWYQRAIANAEVALIVGNTRVALRAVPASDPESVELASDGFRKKYPRGRSLDAMVHPEVLHTTLRLEPTG